MNAPIKKKSFDEDENGMPLKKDNGSTGKIVNLCEDMDYHDHDDKSYDRMKSLSRKKEQNSKNKRYDTDED